MPLAKVNNLRNQAKSYFKIAKSEPHAVYAAYLHREQHKYTYLYFKRTLVDIGENLKPLDQAIDNLLLPSLLGCELNDDKRNVMSLTIRGGGLKIRKVSENSDESFRTTAQEAARTNSIKSTQTAQMQRTLEQLSEPGASSWLGALPLKSQGFNLTKSEFHDVMALRYHKEVKNLPSTCSCCQPFNITHSLDCHLGGFVNARHDSIRAWTTAF